MSTQSSEGTESSKLNFLSENFDASVCLTASNVSIPVENVMPCSSVSECVRIMGGVDCSKGKETKITDQSQITKAERRNRLLAMMQQRHQSGKEESKDDEDLKGKRSTRHLRNVFSFMEKSEAKGPMGTLYKCMRERIKVKVWIRNYKHIRGICTGYLSAFDKHWNLALTDVDESFVLYRKRKSPAMAKTIDKNYQEEPQNVSDNANVSTSHEVDHRTRGYGHGAMLVSSTAKLDTYQRHVNQLFVRGDNVVLVALVT